MTGSQTTFFTHTFYFCLMKLGEQIKATRAAQGVTQKSLAEASGLTERTIQRIENHEVEPSAHSLRRISHVLGEDFLTAKMKQQRRLQRFLSGVVAMWTLAVAYNVFFSPFDWTQRWYEILIWFFCLIGVVSGEIRFAYPRKK